MIYCVKTSINEYKRKLNLLIQKCLVDPKYKITCSETQCIIPVKRNIKDLKTLENLGLKLIECSPPLNDKRGKNLKKIFKEYLGDELLNYVPRSYDIIGETIIIQLPEELRDYFCFIADLLLYLHPNVKAVYRRLSETKGEYRIRELELIGGAEIKETIYREHGLSFYVILGLVYINPSFSYEHKTIAELVESGEKIFDMFAGIGGFTLNIAALKNTQILAVDINPWAVYCGLYSMKLNKRKLKANILYANSDIRTISTYLRKDYFNRIIMNLPLYSLDFLSIAIDHVRDNGIIHFYAVDRNIESLIDKIVVKAESYYKPIKVDIINTRKVLEYAPYKYIYRVDLLIRKTINSA